MTRKTYTHAILEVPDVVYAAIFALLEAAGYVDRIDSGLIDMQGIALRAKGKGAVTEITVSSLVSRRDGQGKVELQLNGEITQMDLDKAREVVGMMQTAIEASVSDQLIVQFLTARIGLGVDQANAALIEFREMRQGSKDRVHPS